MTNFNLGLEFYDDCYPITGNVALYGENKSFFVYGRFEIRRNNGNIYVSSNKWIREPESKNANVNEGDVLNYYCNYRLYLDKNIVLTKENYKIRAIEGKAKIDSSFSLTFLSENPVKFSMLPVINNDKNIIYEFILAEE